MSPFNPLWSYSWVFVPILVWTVFWKGYALWLAVKNEHKKWFVALILFNTLGILEIIYIFRVAKKNWEDVKKVLTKIVP